MTVDVTREDLAGNYAIPPVGRNVSPREFRIELTMLPAWAHPEVVYWYKSWQMIRDAGGGERPVKDAGSYYLPALEGMEPNEYNTFKDRATYYNFTGRTVNAMSGSIFRRQPVVENLKDDLMKRLERFGRDSSTFDTFSSLAAEEVMKTGRYGVLLDMPATPTPDPRPYAVGYTAENILDWEEAPGEDGFLTLQRLVLREGAETRDNTSSSRKVHARYRELVLVPNPAGGQMYVQYVYEIPGKDAELKPELRGPAIIPLRRGEPLNFIPFRIFGPHKSCMSVEKPPMEDIALLNLSHYRSYAYLEHGRFFAGFPIYTAEEPQGGGDVDFKIGASRVWVIAAGGKAGIIELNGQGLKFLENALEQKEAQAATLGGRMMDVRSVAASESDNQLKLKERNEQSVLLKLARQLDVGFAQVLRWSAWWQGLSVDEAAKITATFNKDFLFDGIGAREFRAIHAMYKDGLITIEVFFHYLRKANVTPDWMTFDEFKSQVESMTSFPGQPDAEARAAGFKDKAQQLGDANKKTELEILQQEADTLQQQAETAKKVANKPAPAPAKPAPAGPFRP